MAVIIGASTSTGVAGTISAQWSVQAQMNRLWELGSWDPHKTIVTKVENVSLTTYAGAMSSISLSPSASCTDSTATFSVSISPGTCAGGGGGGGLSGKFFLMSYSYTKGDGLALGQESWSGQRWPGGGGGGGGIEFTSAPSAVLQGPAEGSESGDVSNTGIVFGGGTVDGSQGSVSAGFPGLGQADTTTYGIVTSVGGGTLKDDGAVGQGSASIPHHPLYTK